MPKALIIYPNGTTTLENLKDFDAVKAALEDGYLELINFNNKIFAYIDEDGKRKGLEVNQPATKFAHLHGLPKRDYIVGTMVVMGWLNEHGRRDGDEHDVPQEIVDAYLEFYKTL